MSHLQYFAYSGYGEKSQRDLRYSQAVRVGDRVECSGQGELVGKANFRELVD